MNTHQLAIAVTLVACLLPSLTNAQSYYSGRNDAARITPTAPPNLVFPVQGTVSFSNDFGDPRSGGRTHEGVDMMAAKMTPVVAVTTGLITFAPFVEPSYGYTISLLGDDGYEYDYLHLNNDTPGTDDGLGGVANAYAPGIARGVRVTAGQFIGYVGDSGNAEDAGSHLHLEIRLPNGSAINPYQYLKAAQLGASYDKAAALAAAPTINADLGLVADPAATPACASGSLIRTAASKSVYYCGANGRRYVFPNAMTYATWYADFSTVQVVSDEAMAGAILGGNVYRYGYWQTRC